MKFSQPNLKVSAGRLAWPGRSVAASRPRTATHRTATTRSVTGGRLRRVHSVQHSDFFFFLQVRQPKNGARENEGDSLMSPPGSPFPSTPRPGSRASKSPSRSRSSSPTSRPGSRSSFSGGALDKCFQNAAAFSGKFCIDAARRAPARPTAQIMFCCILTLDFKF